MKTIKYILTLIAVMIMTIGNAWAQTLLDGKKWTQYNMSSGTSLLGGNLQGAAYYNGKIYSFRQNNGTSPSTNKYNVYDIATNTWTAGAEITCAPGTHMGSAAFGPNVVSSYTKGGTTYNCTLPFVFVTGHGTMNTDGTTGSTKYIYCAVVDIENNQLITRFAFPDRYDDCIMAYDFNYTGNVTRVWVIGYQSVSIGNTVDRRGKSPYVIEEYHISNDIFLSQTPSKTEFTHSDSEYKGMMMGGGPNAEGIQETLECGTVQDVFYNDNHLYLCTGRGSEYNRTEYAKVHCFDVIPGNHHIEKTIVTPEYGESQGIVCDGDDNIWVLVSGGTGKMWKYAAGTGYDNFNFQEPSEVSPATTPATYSITNGSELCWFLQQVYGGRTTINAKLANDIDLSGITLPTSFYVYMDEAAAITGGFDAQYAFRGTFDGQNHGITNLSITKTPYYNNGLFPYCIGATVENVTVSGTITPTTCRTSAGNNQPVANIGMIGYMDGGTVSYVDVSGLTINEANTVSGTVNKVIGYGTGNIIMNGVTGVETYTITWKDDDNTTILKQTQVIAGREIVAPANPSKDGYIFQAWNPAFTAGTTATADATYTATYEVNPYDSNGFKKTGTNTDADYYQPADLVDDWYEIDNAGKMFWFANQVNAGNATYNAKVTKDIDMDGTNHTDFPGIGYYISTASGDRKPFSGNFDGQGHRIYNCNITTNNSSYWGSGLIGYATGVNKTIKNFTLEGTITAKCGARAGGVLGYIAQGYTISGITSSVTINSTTFKTGGVVGFLNKGTMNMCRFNGTINNSNNWTGGLAAEVLGACSVTNCLFDGTINATTSNNNAVGGIAAIAGDASSSSTFSYCLSYGTITTKSTGTNTGKVFAKVGGSITLTNVYYGEQGSSTPTSDYDANGKAITGSVTTITTQTWDEIKTALNNGTTNWGISSKDYPVPGDVDATQYTVTFNAMGGSACASVTKVANSVITLPTSEKSGYVFNGWNTAENGTGTKYAAGASYTVTANATLYAQWAEAYTITFSSMGGLACASVTKVANSVITLPASEKAGFVFNGWNTAENGTGTSYAAGASYTITANATLYAQWKEAYTITFNSKGGSACASVTNVAGTEITLPTPTRDDYLFNGWNTKEDGTGTLYGGGASYTITANATLYAQWTEDETGDYRNGFHKTHAKTADDYYQEPVLLTADKCTEIGIATTYAGYYQVKNAGNMFWIAKNLSADNNTRKYVMTDNINMAGDDANHKDWAGIGDYNGGNSAKHFMGTFDGLGHKFTNFYMKPTGDRKSLFNLINGATLQNFSIAGNVEITDNRAQIGAVVARVQSGASTLTDIYSSVNFTVTEGKTPQAIGGIVGQCSAQTTFNRCRYSGTIDGKSAYRNLGGIFGNAEAVVTVNNCLFDGSISSTSTVTGSGDNAIQIGGVAGRNNNKTTITNCLVNGTISVAADSEALDAEKTHTGIIFGYQYTTQPLTITNTYYSTTGSTSGLRAVGLNSATDKSKAAPTEITTQTWDAIKTALNGSSDPVNWGINSQLYPVPGEKDGVTKYTITFNTDGGTEIAPIVQAVGTAVTAPENPTKTGYTFAGWDKTIPATMPAENITIKATWTINQYTITFNTDGGSAVVSITQDYGTSVTAPANPTKTGHNFAGWKDAEGHDATVPATMPAENITLTAKWTINQYTITFNTDGGSAVASITQDYGSSVTAPANPTKTGHTFAGWDKTIPTTMPAENITITARWTINQYTIFFDLNGGTSAAIDPITQNYGTTITAPADPTRTDWNFDGWSPDVPNTMPANNMTCVAQWSKDTYTNGFNDNWSTCATDKKYEEATQDGDGYYIIDNGGKLFWFAIQQVNQGTGADAGQGNKKAKLTADINLESRVFPGIGQYKTKVTGTKEVYYLYGGGTTWTDKTKAGSTVQDGQYVGKGGVTYTYGGHSTVLGAKPTASTVDPAGELVSGNVYCVTENVSGVDYTYAFTGEFDGQGHTISNFYMSNTATIKGLINFTGNGATIKDFTISGNVDITGGGQVGSVIGRVGDITKLEDVHSSVNITVALSKTISAIGGLIGQAAGNTTLNRCRYNGTITGNSSFNALGGIIGNAENPITLDNCLFDGTISTTAKETRTSVDNGIKIGGLCGRNNNTTKITNSMSLGTITVTPSEGTFDGANSNVGIIYGTQINTNKLTITNTNYSTSNCTTGIGAVGNNSNTDKTSAAPTELPVSPNWTVIRKTLGMSNWVIDQEKYGKEYPIPALFICTHVYDQYGFCIVCEAPEPIGEPDADGYYHIDHFADLGQFAAMVNGSVKGTEINAKVTKDIDLTDLGRDITTMIGDKDHPYCGTFDGQGYTCKGFNVTAGSEQRYVGVFACVGIKDTDAAKVKNGIVKNFSVDGTITASYFSKWNTNTPLVMGVIGEVYSGTIENVHSSVDFVCTSGTRSHIGGVVGGSLHMSGDAGEIVIKNCTYEGTMTLNACDAIGGILGYAQHKTKISNTLYSGSITQNYTRPVGEEDNGNDQGPCSTYIGGVLGYCNSVSNGVQNSIIVGDMESNLTDFLTDAMSAKKNNMNICVGFDNQINAQNEADNSAKNYYGNYITPEMLTKYHQLPVGKFSNTAKERTDAEFATGAVCAELNEDASATDNPWGQILGYQVGYDVNGDGKPERENANGTKRYTEKSPAQRYPFPGYTDHAQTSYKVVRTQNAQDNTKYDYLADYYFFDDFGDTTPMPSDAASMTVKKIEYTRQESTLGEGNYISMCLPFDFTSEMKPSSDDKLFVYDHVEGTQVYFKEIKNAEAGTPFILKTNTDNLSLPKDGTIETSVALNAGTYDDGASTVTNTPSAPGLYGTFNTKLLGTGYWKLKDDGTKFVKTTATSHCYPYRCYLKLPDTAAPSTPSQAKQYIPVFEEDATDVKTVSAPTSADGACYNIMGQRVGKDAKGIVIVNGKKILRR